MPQQKRDDLSTIIIADKNMIHQFGKPVLSKGAVLAFILPDLNENQIDRLCNMLNHHHNLPAGEKTRAEPVSQDHQHGIRLTSETKTRDELASLLLSAIKNLPITQPLALPAPGL